MLPDSYLLKRRKEGYRVITKYPTIDQLLEAREQGYIPESGGIVEYMEYIKQERYTNLSFTHEQSGGRPIPEGVGSLEQLPDKRIGEVTWTPERKIGKVEHLPDTTVEDYKRKELDKFERSQKQLDQTWKPEHKRKN